jgi:RNA polymerase sigma-70 factor (ECF subfamily)
MGALLQRVDEAVDFQTAYRELYPSLHRFVLRMTGDADVADDVVQEAFTRLVERNLPLEEAKPWLHVVAMNLVRDRARNRQRRDRLLEETPPEPDRPEAADLRVERLERIARVRRALAELSERDARMLLMREEGFKYSEIAEVMGVKSTSVGALVARALKRFASAYDSLEEVDGTSD